MKDIKLLDCTLRDGGYLNDWEFGYTNLISTFERLVNTNTEIIEIGFLDERRNFDINRSIMPDSKSAGKIYGKVDKKKSIIVGMIDYGTCSINQLEKCEDSYLDGIRVIFKKHLMHEAIAFCKQVKDLGYKVFAQAVSITSYNDEELMELVDLVNELEPYAMSMVDTYGLLYKENLMHYFVQLDKHLKKGIGLGYHSHNNFQLAYSNCMEVLRYETKRPVIIDGTLYGMGKSAGNAPIELLAMHLNEQYEKNYDISQMLEAIDGNIMQWHQKTPWGYSMFYYVAASNHCHPNYVQALMDRHTLSIKSINEILDKIEDEKKLLFDKKYIEELYYEYQKEQCDDSEDKKKLISVLNNKEILILGPGSSLKTEASKISRYIKEKQPILLSINFIPDDFDVDYVFLSNPRRYIRLMHALKEKRNANVEIIATSNVTKAKGKFSYTLNNSSLLDKNAVVMDYSFVMLLKALKNIGVNKVTCAGLDGYSEKQPNYASKDMEYWFAKRNADLLNQYVTEFLDSIASEMPVDFITTTLYRKNYNEKI